MILVDRSTGIALKAAVRSEFKRSKRRNASRARSVPKKLHEYAVSVFVSRRRAITVRNIIQTSILLFGNQPFGILGEKIQLTPTRVTAAYRSLFRIAVNIVVDRPKRARTRHKPVAAVLVSCYGTVGITVRSSLTHTRVYTRSFPYHSVFTELSPKPLEVFWTDHDRHSTRRLLTQPVRNRPCSLRRVHSARAVMLRVAGGAYTLLGNFSPNLIRPLAAERNTQFDHYFRSCARCVYELVSITRKTCGARRYVKYTAELIIKCTH